MQGIGAEHYTWKRLPARESNERIARYGQGFSKILSTLRDDISNQGSLMHHVQESKSFHQKKHSTFDNTPIFEIHNGRFDNTNPSQASIGNLELNEDKTNKLNGLHKG